MTMYVTAGHKGNTKKLRSRFGGDAAWKQHSGDDRQLAASHKARCAELAGQCAMAEFEHVGDGEPFFYGPVVGADSCCLESGNEDFVLPRCFDGCVEVEGGVTLVYRRGKLTAALCG